MVSLARNSSSRGLFWKSFLTAQIRPEARRPPIRVLLSRVHQKIRGQWSFPYYDLGVIRAQQICSGRRMSRNCHPFAVWPDSHGDICLRHRTAVLNSACFTEQSWSKPQPSPSQVAMQSTPFLIRHGIHDSALRTAERIELMTHVCRALVFIVYKSFAAPADRSSRRLCERIDQRTA